LDIKKALKKPPILADQTLFVKPYIKPSNLYIKPCYNFYMTRNHFSKKNGPYFTNDGLSHHSEQFIKPDKDLFYFVLVGFGILLAVIGIVLYSL
jgi:hypothetical protein